MMKNSDIEYWTRLCQQPQFGIVNESKSKLFDAFEDAFGKDYLYSSNNDFTLDAQTMNKAFDVLNSSLFDSKLQKIEVVCLPASEIQAIFDKYRNWYRSKNQVKCHHCIL